MKKKKVLLIAHFCDYGHENSNNRFNYIAQLLHENDYNVELVTSSFSHRDKKQRQEDNFRDYKMTLIYEPSYKKNVSLKRFFYSHYIMACNLKKYLETCEKPDLVYCAVPSLDVANVAKQYANKNQVPFVIDVQDLWPEAFQMVFNIPIVSNLLFFPVKRKADSVYRASDEIVSVSKTYAERAMKKNMKCSSSTVVYLGTDLQVFDQNAKRNVTYSKSEECIWLAYCGTLGHSYDLTRVFRVLDILKQRHIEDYQFIVMGDGPLRKEYEKIACNKELPVMFTGKLKYEEMCAVLTKCDICINPISSGAAQSIINKHADYAASGLPVISTQENEEYQKMIETYEMGFNCDKCTDEQMADVFEELFAHRQKREEMGSNARKCAEELFDRRKTYMQIVDLISQTMHD